MTCEVAIALLGEYLETALTPERLERLEAHLADCAPCRAYLNTYRKTRDVTASAGRVEMPEDMKRRLRAFLLAELQEPDAGR
jgi:predicted anti-sigma-YlaC factor YlaD